MEGLGTMCICIRAMSALALELGLGWCAQAGLSQPKSGRSRVASDACGSGGKVVVGKV